MAAMTKQEFIDYWTKPEGDAPPYLRQFEETLGEHECQFQSERALYGDAGPGQGLVIREMREELATVKSRLKSFGVAI